MNKYIESILGISIGIKENLINLHTDTVPVNYYVHHNNWGDQLNKYLIEKITGKVVIKNSFKKNTHILAIGSVLSSASKNSIIWGSGFISRDSMLKTTKLDIRAVRGALTKEKLELEYSIQCPNILGDPAVLLPIYYKPKTTEKKYLVGIVPHYKDKDLTAVKNLIEMGCVFIDIQDNIESFVDKINECEFILSSSLHGLIAADTYNISNLWVSFSDKIIGGNFKFLDYYSTTDNPNPAVTLINAHDFYEIPTLINKCRNNKFLMSKEELIAAFPKEYL